MSCVSGISKRGSGKNDQFRVAAATHSFDRPGTKRTRSVLVAAGSDRFRRHRLLAAAHDRAVWVKRRVSAERYHESVVFVRTLPYHGGTSLYAEQLIVFRAGNTRFYVGGVGLPPDVNGALRRGRTARVGCAAHVLGLCFITCVFTLVLRLRGSAVQ